MKKILLLIPQNVIPSTDGGKHGLYYPMKILGEKYNVKVVVFVGDHEQKNTLAYREINIDAVFLDTDKTDNIFNVIGNIFKKLPFKFDRYFSIKNINTVLDICKTWKPELAICHHAHLALYGKIISTNYPSIKLILREHNIEYVIIKQYAQTSKNLLIKAAAYWQYFKAKKIEEQSWSWFNKVLFISNSDIKIANKNKANKNYILIADGSNLSPIINTKKQDAFLFAGTLTTLQNVYNLKYFINNIWKPWKNLNNNNYELWISGNSKTNALQKLNITEPDLEKFNIKILGFVDDIKNTIQSAKFFLSPTIIGAGIRMKVLEAMCNGSVVFLTKIDIEMLNILNNSNVVEYNSVDEFNEKFNQFNINEILYNSVAKSAYDLATKELTWDTFSKKYLVVVDL